MVRFPGERSLTLGTPGLHDASPLGFGMQHRNPTQMTKPTPHHRPRPIHEPQRGSVMQPKGAEPWASAPLGFACPTAPIPFLDRNAVPSRAMRWRRDVRVTEPR